MILTFDPPRTATTKSNEKIFFQFIVIWQKVLGLIESRIIGLSRDVVEAAQNTVAMTPKTEAKNQKQDESSEIFRNKRWYFKIYNFGRKG